LYNIFEAEKIRCDIITVPTSILKKTKLINKNLNSYSLETVKDFYEDAKSTKFTI
jgi:transaldolase